MVRHEETVVAAAVTDGPPERSSVARGVAADGAVVADASAVDAGPSALAALAPTDAVPPVDARATVGARATTATTSTVGTAARAACSATPDACVSVSLIVVRLSRCGFNPPAERVAEGVDG
jgi:hypothetical protein